MSRRAAWTSSGGRCAIRDDARQAGTLWRRSVITARRSRLAGRPSLPKSVLQHGTAWGSEGYSPPPASLGDARGFGHGDIPPFVNAVIRAGRQQPRVGGREGLGSVPSGVLDVGRASHYGARRGARSQGRRRPWPRIRRGVQHPLVDRCRGSKGRSPSPAPGLYPGYAGSPALAVEATRRRGESWAIRIAIPYSQGTDSGHVNRKTKRVVPRVPASSRKLIDLRQRLLRRHPKKPLSSPPGPTLCDAIPRLGAALASCARSRGYPEREWSRIRHPAHDLSRISMRDRRGGIGWLAVFRRLRRGSAALAVEPEFVTAQVLETDVPRYVREQLRQPTSSVIPERLGRPPEPQRSDVPG